MNALFRSCLALLLVAIAASAGDAGYIIKQKARRVANPGGQPAAPVRPVPAPAPPPAPAAAPKPVEPPRAVLTPGEEGELRQLLAELNAIKPGGKPGDAQREKIHKTLRTVAVGSGVAAPSVDTLADDLAAAWASQKMTAAEQWQFAKDIRKAIHGAGLSAEDAQSVVASAQRTLKYGSVEAEAAQKLVETLKAITAGAKR